MAFPKEVISVSEFEKLIDSEELIRVLSGFGLIEPMMKVVEENTNNSFNKIMAMRYPISSLTNRSKYKVKIKNDEKAPVAESSFLLYTLSIVIN